MLDPRAEAMIEAVYSMFFDGGGEQVERFVKVVFAKFKGASLNFADFTGISHAPLVLQY